MEKLLAKNDATFSGTQPQKENEKETNGSSQRLKPTEKISWSSDFSL